MAKHEIPKVQVQSRERLGKRYTARLRKTGQLPAVIYGRGQDPAHVSLNGRELHDLLHRHAHLLDVQIDSRSEPCLIKEVQWNHLGSEVIHVDLTRVDLTSRIKVDVALEFVGEPVGLKEAGTILEHPVQEIEIECLATEIPQSIRVDVSGLGVGDSLTAADLKLPEGVQTTLDPETIIAAVHEVAEEEEAPTAAEGEAAAQPAVIGRKAEEESADAGADAKGKK